MSKKSAKSKKSTKSSSKFSRKSASGKGNAPSGEQRKQGKQEARDSSPAPSEEKPQRKQRKRRYGGWRFWLLIVAAVAFPVIGFGGGVWFYHSKPVVLFGYDPGEEAKKGEAPLFYKTWQRKRQFGKAFGRRAEAQDAYHSEIRKNAGSFVQNPSNPLSGAVYFSDLPSSVEGIGVWSNGQTLGRTRFAEGAVFFNWLYVGTNDLRFQLLDSAGEEVGERGFEIEIELDETLQELLDGDLITQASQLTTPSVGDDRSEEFLSFVVNSGGVSWFAGYDAYGRLRMALYAVGGGSPPHTYRDGIFYSYAIPTADYLYRYDFLLHRYGEAGRLRGYSHHHSLDFGAREGTMITLANKYSEGRQTFNYLLEYEIGSGRILRSVDFRDILDENRLPIADTWKPVLARWVHTNSAYYDGEGDQVVISSRGQGAVFGLSYDDFSLRWIIGDLSEAEIDPEQKARNKDLEKFTLVWNDDLREYVRALPEEIGVTSGQHGARVLRDGRLAIFDNRALVRDEEGHYVAPEDVRSRLLLVEMDSEGFPLTETAEAYSPLGLFSKIKGGVHTSGDGRLTIGYGGICKSELGLLTLSIWSFCPNQRAFMAEFILPNLEDPSLALSVDGQSYSPLYIGSDW
ncbi:MAG: aryl-sulfate sulfotransferase [Alphaproteobacteria bacterium]